MNLIKIVSNKLLSLLEKDAFSPLKALNCIRVLAKVLPLLYESAEFADITNEVFWGDSDLGKKLIFSTVDLLFFQKFTVNSSGSGTRFAVWEPGVGSNHKGEQPKVEIDCNRLEVLRFLFVLCSQCLYSTSCCVVSEGSRFLTVLVTCVPKLKILTLMSSLINTMCRAARETNPTFGNHLLNQVRTSMVTQAIQLLCLMVVYPLPRSDLEFLKSAAPPVNMVRYYYGRLHKEEEIVLVHNSLMAILGKCLGEKAGSSLTLLIKSKTTSLEPSLWSTECVILLWEMFQCNKKYKLHLFQGEGNKLMLYLLYNILSFKNAEKHRNFVRVCTYFVLFLSGDSDICQTLLGPFTEDSLPEDFSVRPRPAIFRDFFVISTCNMLVSSDSLGVLGPIFVQWLYNVMPHGLSLHDQVLVQNRRPGATDELLRCPGSGISYHASSCLMRLVTKFSEKSFLSTPLHQDLLAVLIRALCHCVFRFPLHSRVLIFTLCKNHHLLEAIHTTLSEINGSDTMSALSKTSSNDSSFTRNPSIASLTETSDEELIQPAFPLGMSSKAKGKVSLDAPLEITWSGAKAHKYIVKLVDFITQQVDISNSDSALCQIDSLSLPFKTSSEFDATRTKFEPLRFSWSNISLGWYTSIMWGCIYKNNDLYQDHEFKFLSNTVSAFNSIVSSDWGFGSWSNSESDLIERAQQAIIHTNCWSGTSVKLFRLKEQEKSESVTENLRKRLGDLRSNSNSSITTLPRRSGLSTPTTAPSSPVFHTHNPFSESLDSQIQFKTTPRNSLSKITSRGSVVSTPTRGS